MSKPEIKQKNTPPGAVHHMKIGPNEGAIDVQTPRGGLTCYYQPGHGGESTLYNFSFRNPADFPTIRGFDKAVSAKDGRLDERFHGFLDGVDASSFDLLHVIAALVAVIKSGDMKNISWWNGKAAGNIFGLMREKISRA
jgi:hypothetical protein